MLVPSLRLTKARPLLPGRHGTFRARVPYSSICPVVSTLRRQPQPRNNNQEVDINHAATMLLSGVAASIMVLGAGAAYAEPGLAAESKKLESELQAIITQRAGILQKLESAPQVETSSPAQSKVLEVRSQALRAQLETQNKRINELIAALEGALSKIDQNEANMRAEIEKKAAELAKLKEEMAVVTSKAAAPAAQLESKNAEISRLRTALAAAQAGGGSVPYVALGGAGVAVAGVTGGAVYVNTKKKREEAEQEALLVQQQQAEEEIEGLKEALNQQQALMERVREQAAAGVRRQVDLDSMNRDMQVLRSELEVARTAAINSANNLQAQLESENEEIRRLKAELEASQGLKEALHQQQDMVEKVKKQAAAVARAQRQVEQEKKAREAELTALSAELGTVREQYAAMEARLRTAEAEATTLRQQLKVSVPELATAAASNGAGAAHAAPRAQQAQQATHAAPLSAGAAKQWRAHEPPKNGAGSHTPQQQQQQVQPQPQAAAAAQAAPKAAPADPKVANGAAHTNGASGNNGANGVAAAAAATAAAASNGQKLQPQPAAPIPTPPELMDIARVLSKGSLLSKELSGAPGKTPAPAPIPAPTIPRPAPSTPSPVSTLPPLSPPRLKPPPPAPSTAPPTAPPATATGAANGQPTPGQSPSPFSRPSGPPSPASLFQRRAPDALPVRFTLQRELQLGQGIVLVGNDPLLGGWDVSKGLQMTWGEGHVWSAEAKLPAGTVLEFKCVQTEGLGTYWEEGPNHEVILPRSGLGSLEVAISWAYRVDISGKPEGAEAGKGAGPAAAGKVPPPQPVGV